MFVFSFLRYKDKKFFLKTQSFGMGNHLRKMPFFRLRKKFTIFKILVSDFANRTLHFLHLENASMFCVKRPSVCFNTSVRLPENA